MSYSLETYETYKKDNILFIVALFFMAILLHQSQVMFGTNLSFADLFCGVIFIILLYKNQLLIPITPILFFLVVSIVVLATAVFYVPTIFMYSPEPVSIISDYTKLIAIFMYFIIGYNLSSIQLMNKTLKWYSIFGLLIGSLGIFFTVLNIGIFSEILFFAGVRYRGLMLDPNYFSILQVTALVYISRVKTIKMQYKLLAVGITFFSVLISGSKTGIITFFCYLALRMVEYIFTSKKKVKVIIIQLVSLSLLILISPIVISLFQQLIYYTTISIPSFGRVQSLFTDFNSAVSESGSERGVTWQIALQIIQFSPLFGIGIGTFSNIAFEVFQFNNVAHNTYLQLSAEWGIPLTCVLFVYILFMLIRATNPHLLHWETNLILRDIIIILLIGSMAVSLNNARALWLFLGALACLTMQIRKYDNETKLL